MEYNPQEIEAQWQKRWQENDLYRVTENPEKDKFYVLDMFPYPSGAGLHVGHPLGYIASDIISRYKRLKGYNVLHPMGFDSFGLPAEQYAIDTGQHPALTTEQNINTFKSQLAKIGFSYDWSREVWTSKPEYYKWTQWIFQQIFSSWFDTAAQKARPISEWYAHMEAEGNVSLQAACDEGTPEVSAEAFKAMSEEEQYALSLKYRMTYLSDAFVNWCPALGTVLANDEVKDGRSERGNHPVERRRMRQWSMRTIAYAERLLSGLDELDWSDALKEMQRNWIGKSYGAELDFTAENGRTLTVFTTRPDTTFGVTFISVAPEHDWVEELITDEQRKEVEEYIEYAKNRSERQRQTEVENVSGVFTGSYAINPFNGERVPIWIADYVLASYGTGIVMAVPASDERDYRFAKHFGLEIKPVLEGTNIEEGAFTSKEAKVINSGFLNGMIATDAIQAAIKYAEEKGFGRGKVNYRLRDSVFSRQRYWGEPVPVYFKNDLPYLVPEEKLPLELPEVSEYLPTEDGQPPLGRAEDWKYEGEYPYELTTMPGWAGSSWYFLRYMDAQNSEEFAAREKTDYWNQVDLYIGGTEHAVGHLLYSRFWTKVLYDLGYLGFDEPFKKLINQGMIQGRSSLAYRLKDRNAFVSADRRKEFDCSPLHINVAFVQNDILDIEALRGWREEFETAEFILSEDGKFRCGHQVEKMSKRWYNVVNPDDVVANYSADTLRLYEMFLGPLEASKPWNTDGIDGVHRFLKKLWRLCVDGQGNFAFSDEKPSDEEYKALHKALKKIEEDMERYQFNTVVSAAMVAVNEFASLKCNKREILAPFLIALSPYAPHITEELWHRMGNTESIHSQTFPKVEEKYLVEDQILYPVSINGKVRAKIELPAEATAEVAREAALAHEAIQKWVDGKQVVKFIHVPKRIINIVVK